MLNKKTFFTCASTLAVGMTLSSTAIASGSVTLPENVQKSLSSAFFTNDAFVIDSVANAAKTANPEWTAAIEDFINTLKSNTDSNSATKVSQATELAATTPAAGEKKEERNWDGSVEAGANFSTGNTKQQQLSLSGTFDYKIADNITNETKFLAESDKQNNVRTEEEYTIENKTKWSFTEKDYAFLDLEYNKDRFSNQDHRITELVGYGRELYKTETMSLKGEVSAGFVQTEFSNGDSEDGEQFKIEGIYDWQITDNLHFAEEVSYSINSDFDIFESDTSIKSDLSENLYLKFSVNVENVSEAPAGTKNTDTTTKVTVGYDF